MRLLLLVSLLLLQSACGFTLRTWDMDSEIESIQVVGNDSGGELTRAVVQAFSQAGVTVVGEPGVTSAAMVAKAADSQTTDATETAEEQLTLSLLNVSRDRRSVSVTGQARAAEYELLLNVQYELTEGPQAQHIAPRWLRVQRVYRVDRNNLMGSSEEESLLRREMHSDAVQQILRAVNQVMGSAS